MGLAIQKAFPRLWEPYNKPFWDEMRKTRRANIQRALPISYAKDGNFLEQRYVDWNMMPVLDDDMEVIGSYHSLLDVTWQSLEQRRTETLSAISAIVSHSHALGNTWNRIIEQLANKEDIPQALLYSLSSKEEDPTRLYCTLEGNISCKPSIALEQFELRDPRHGIAKIFRHSMAIDRPLYLSKRPAYSHSDLWLQVKASDPAHSLSDLLPSLLNDFKPSTSGDACDSVVVMPVELTHSKNTKGFVIFGLHTRQAYDEAYQSFMMLLQQTISTTVTSAILSRERLLQSKQAEVAQADLSAQLLRQTEETKAIENRFSQLARHAPVGICIYRADGAMAFANHKWYSLCDFPEGSDSTSPGWWASIVYPDDLPHAFSSFSQLQLDKQHVHFEIRLAAPSKQYPSSFTWVLVSAYPELREDDELESIVAFFTDITEQKWAAEVERKRTEDALEAKRQQESFVDITSHEIRNPLSVSLQCSEEICSIAEDAIRGAPPYNTSVSLSLSDLQDICHAAEVIKQCTMHQKRIIDDILILSKMEGGMLPFSTSLTQPLMVAKNTLALFSREFIHTGTEIDFQIDPSFEEAAAQLDWLEFDSGRLSQMLINLMTNAIKFTKSQSKRRIELKIGASSTLSPISSCKSWLTFNL